MDRDLNPIVRRKRLFKRIIIIVVLAAVAVTILVYGPGWLRRSLDKERIRTSRVDIGPISSMITAGGIVEAEIEHVLSSPIGTRILKVIHQPGDQLQMGDPLIELDTSQTRLELEKLAQRIDLKQNQQTQERLDLENTLVSLRSQRDVQQLELDSRSSDAGRMRQLFDDGLASQSQLDQALVEERKARVQLVHLKAKMEQARQLTTVKLEGLAMEMVILRKELVEAERQLDLATTASDRAGVLTWIIQEEGVTVQQGEVLARIADLSSFRVRANLSDVHAGRLSSGLPAVIRINNEQLHGHIRSILPTISDGVVSIIVALDEPDHSLLRANLRVDVQVVTDRKAEALRIRRGPAIQESGRQQVYVVRGEKAVRISAVFGISDFQYFEVVEGLLEGDEVILSDMKAYMHLEVVSIN